eukprot:COSAG04_NODE_160_length_22034_cov_4.774151_20_plen_146_part_00
MGAQNGATTQFKSQRRDKHMYTFPGAGARERRGPRPGPPDGHLDNTWHRWCEKTHLFRAVFNAQNAIILPRQARDTHKESTQNEMMCFLQMKALPTRAKRRAGSRSGAKTTAVFIRLSLSTCNDVKLMISYFTKTGSGQTHMENL